MADISLKECYLSWNKKYFRNKLPLNARVCFKANLNCYGHYKDEYQVLAKRVRGPQKGEYRVLYSRPHTICVDMRLKKQKDWCTVGITLLHEMAHMHLYIKDGYTGHGNKFQREMKRLANAGAFRNFW